MVTNNAMWVYAILQYLYHQGTDIQSMFGDTGNVKLLPGRINIDTETETASIGIDYLDPEVVAKYYDKLSFLIDNEYTELILYNPSAVRALIDMSPVIKVLSQNDRVVVRQCSIAQYDYIMVTSKNYNVCVVSKHLFAALQYRYPTLTNLTFVLPCCPVNSCKGICGPDVRYTDIIPLLHCAYDTSLWQYTAQYDIEYQALYNTVCASNYDRILEVLRCIDADLPDKVNALLDSAMED